MCEIKLQSEFSAGKYVRFRTLQPEPRKFHDQCCRTKSHTPFDLSTAHIGIQRCNEFNCEVVTVEENKKRKKRTSKWIRTFLSIINTWKRATQFLELYYGRAINTLYTVKLEATAIRFFMIKFIISNLYEPGLTQVGMARYSLG